MKNGKTNKQIDKNIITFMYHEIELDTYYVAINGETVDMDDEKDIERLKELMGQKDTLLLSFTQNKIATNFMERLDENMQYKDIKATVADMHDVLQAYKIDPKQDIGLQSTNDANFGETKAINEWREAIRANVKENYNKLKPHIQDLVKNRTEEQMNALPHESMEYQTYKYLTDIQKKLIAFGRVTSVKSHQNTDPRNENNPANALFQVYNAFKMTTGGPALENHLQAISIRNRAYQDKELHLVLDRENWIEETSLIKDIKTIRDYGREQILDSLKENYQYKQFKALSDMVKESNVKTEEFSILLHDALKQNMPDETHYMLYDHRKCQKPENLASANSSYFTEFMNYKFKSEEMNFLQQLTRDASSENAELSAQSTYNKLREVAEANDGRVPFLYNYAATATGRDTSGKPLHEGKKVFVNDLYINAHGLNGDHKHMLSPQKEGHVHFEIDMSQLEVRTLAAMLGHKSILKTKEEYVPQFLTQASQKKFSFDELPDLDDLDFSFEPTQQQDQERSFSI